MIENRRWPRVTLKIPVEFSLIVPGHAEVSRAVPSVVLDLSERGVLVETIFHESFYPQLLKELRWCRIDLSHPDLPTQLIGKIVSVDRIADPETKYRLGIYLEDLRAQDEQQLQQFVAASRARSREAN